MLYGLFLHLYVSLTDTGGDIAAGAACYEKENRLQTHKKQTFPCIHKVVLTLPNTGRETTPTRAVMGITMTYETHGQTKGYIAVSP